MLWTNWYREQNESAIRRLILVRTSSGVASAAHRMAAHALDLSCHWSGARVTFNEAGPESEPHVQGWAYGRV